MFIGSAKPVKGREEWKKVERYYGTEYDIAPLNIIPSSEVFPGLSLPKSNPFIPSDLELVKREENGQEVRLFFPRFLEYADVDSIIQGRPTLIRQTIRSRLYHKQDEIWKIPRGTVYILLKTQVHLPLSLIQTRTRR